MYVSKFRTDTAYGTDDINEITAILSGNGVVPSTPNDILKALVQDGVTVSDEQCAVSFADSTKKSVRIGNGTVIMPDGSYLIVSGGVTLTLSETGKVYVYIEHDELEQNVPICSATAPSSSDVLLATVENGVVTDARHYAKSRINGFGSNKTTQVTYTGTQVKNFSETNEAASDSPRIFPLDTDTAYNYLILTYPDLYENPAVVISLGESLSLFAGKKLSENVTVQIDSEHHRILLVPYDSQSLSYTLKALYL